ncbi:MAG: glutamate racemase [Oscillospiraceae bacterium]
MDYRPVGIFDSGMGGLTAVRVLRELLPGEDIAYLGDTARVPYGGRSVAELIEIARSDALSPRAGDKAMLVACGTVSSNCLDEVEKTAGVPVIGVVKPAAAGAAASTKTAASACSPPWRQRAPAPSCGSSRP